MKNKFKAVVSIGTALTLFSGSLSGCSSKKKVTVTWYDATGTTNVSEMKVLKTEKVEVGAYLTSYAPIKEGGYEFVDWFAVPSKNHRFDFTSPIEADTAVYAGFTLYTEDTRDYYVLGSGTSELLFSSNWGKVMNENYKLTKASGKNEYTITMDLKEGDEFQFAINSAWANQRGFGYLVETELSDGTTVFSSNASPYTDAAKKANIKVDYSGNYTFTLRTYPNEDYYDTSSAYYTEATKENYNLGTYDTITWVRNGDVLKDSVTITDFYIKGSGITGWADMYNASTQMIQNGSVYTLSVYLKEGEQFLFTSRNTKIENGETTTSVGSTYIKSDALDSESRNLVDGYSETGGNMTIKASGYYTFAYDEGTGVLSVTKEDRTPVSYDYYLDGTIGVNGAWNAFVDSPEDYRLTETSEGSGVYAITKVLTEGQSVQIRACAAGETPTTSNTANNLFQYAYLKSNPSFEAVSAADNNIKVLSSGTYVIAIDSYSKIITISEYIDSADIYDIYIKGSGINNWSHDFSSDYRFTISSDETAYEYTLTIAEGTTVQFGLAKYGKGESTGYGDYLGLSAIGTDGDANALFNPESGSNFECATAGTYRIVYAIDTGLVDFYTVTE